MVCVHIHRAMAQQQRKQEQPSPPTQKASNSNSGEPAATNNNNNGRQTWTLTGQHLQHAATLLQYLRELVSRTQSETQPPAQDNWNVTLRHPFLEIWETYCLAEAQYCAYCTFKLQPRPKHFLLAKLAAANLFQQVEDLCQLYQASSGINNAGYSFLLDWEDSVRAWGMWMTAVAEYHQSIVHKEKKEWGIELARLEGALKFAKFCKEFCDSTDSDLLDGLLGEIQPVMEQIDERSEFAEHENSTVHHQLIPEHDELPDITPQLTVKTEMELIHKLLPGSSRVMFHTVVTDPDIGRYVATFNSDIQNLIQEAEQLAEVNTESARNQLAAVNLPHSLTVYRQEQSLGRSESGGSGISDFLWQRVQDVQHEQRTVKHLKQDLWQLQNMAETAHNTFQSIGQVLDEDLELDSMFRRQNPDFEGHDVQEIQKTFRQALQNYHRLMVSANESDTLLTRRSKVLESDSKFQLLQLPRSQLDRLVSTATRQSEIDVSLLSNYLVDLSSVFNERDVLLQTLQERYQTHDIAQQLAACTTEDDYPQVLDAALASFQEIVDDLDENMDQQSKLLYHILQENDQFMRLRDRESQEVAQDSALVQLEDALEEVDLCAKHLSEGRTFYDVVIPKLEKLQRQVRDVSDRLALERQDFEDCKPSLRQQLNNNGSRYLSSTSSGMSGGGGYDSRAGGAEGYTDAHSGSMSSGHSSRGRYESDRTAPKPRDIAASYQPQNSNASVSTEVQVDDSKVANLVAMEFDPEKVVAALKRHGNDFDLALNDLLSC